MAGLMNVGEMGALALHSMLEVGKKDRKGDKGWLSTTELAETLEASRHTLHKVVKRLVKAGLLISARGPLGGVKLQIPSGEISLLRIIEAVDGEIYPGGCLFARRICSDDFLCQFCTITVDLEQMVRGYFANTTIADLLDRLNGREIIKRNGPAA